MAHKFNGNNRSRLGRKERVRLLAPARTLRELGYPRGHAAADIGCGIGVFTLPMAKACGKDGVVYAVDISREMLSEVKRRAAEAGAGNIIPVPSAEYDFRLADGAVDFVLICAVLHEVDDKIRFLREAARICSDGGEAAVIEFNETETACGPPLSDRVTRREVAGWLSASGFHPETVSDKSGTFYTVTARKILKEKKIPQDMENLKL